MLLKTLALMVVTATVAGCEPVSEVTEAQLQPRQGGAASRVQLIAPAAEMPGALIVARMIEEPGRRDVTVTPMEEYAPLVDALAYDAFIVLSTRPDQPAKPGLIADLQRTSAPVLWAGYGVSQLGADHLRRFGFEVAPAGQGTYRLSHGTRASVLGRGEPVVTAELDHRPSRRSAALPVTVTGLIASAREDAFLIRVSRGASTHAAAGQAGRFAFYGILPSFVSDEPDMLELKGLADRLLAAADTGAVDAAPPPKPAEYARRIEEARADPFATAVHLPVYIAETRDGFHGYDSDKMHEHLVRIRDAGAEWVVVQRIHYQNGVAANDIFADPNRTVTDASLANIVADAHKLGLKVRLVLVVNLTEESMRPGDWRGVIKPADPDSWWARYTEIVVASAKFAAEQGIEALDVGAELSALLGEEVRWRRLVGEVRGAAGFKGLVGYQANFHRARDIRWTEVIDYLAIAAYWPLTERARPSAAELDAAWAEIWAGLGPWVREHPELRVEFGEIGYAAQPYAAMMPFSWKPDKQQRLDVEEQVAAYRALERFLAKHPEIRGVAIFASTHEDTMPEAIGYSPFAKPALEVVRRILRR